VNIRSSTAGFRAGNLPDWLSLPLTEAPTVPEDLGQGRRVNSAVQFTVTVIERPLEPSSVGARIMRNR